MSSIDTPNGIHSRVDQFAKPLFCSSAIEKPGQRIRVRRPSIRGDFLLSRDSVSQNPREYFCRDEVFVDKVLCSRTDCGQPQFFILLPGQNDNRKPCILRHHSMQTVETTRIRQTQIQQGNVLLSLAISEIASATECTRVTKKFPDSDRSKKRSIMSASSQNLLPAELERRSHSVCRVRSC